MDRNVGYYTCQRYTGKNTIDYVLLSATLITYSRSILYVDVLDKNLSGTHSPICLSLFENIVYTDTFIDYKNSDVRKQGIIWEFGKAQ